MEKAKENYEEHKEEKLKYQKEYAANNQEKIKDYLKEYNEKNKEQILANQKIYREENKEEIAAMQKKWREIHQTELKEKKGQIIQCPCGSEYTFGNQDRHFHSKKHLLYENQGIMEKKEEGNFEKDVEKPKQEKNIIKSKESRNKYNEIHKEEIKKQCKKYYEENKNKIFEQTKIYVEENKEKIKNYKDDWYQKNKEKILANQKETFACECGSNVRCAGRAEHLRSVKHKTFIQKIINI